MNSNTNTHPRIPTSTYRLQFHAGFTFRDACGILDYLSELGISDVYASPYFQASPTSTHGYDVADHNRINPAIGDDSDFRFYTGELRKRGLGQVLDFVPNHMGIGLSLNHWWMEVLEDGVASPYSHYFDIDWHPRKEALADRVLLPVLGDRYGKVLENDELKLSFENGSFFINYFETRLPINPRSYPVILRVAEAQLNGESVDQLREIIAHFDALTHGRERAEAKVTAKKQLLDLMAANPAVADAVEMGMASFHGQAGEPASFDALHELLEAQVYRLSYWRVAAEEINYRRFFDINTLAAIRVEIPEVFEAAHQLVFELLARGDVTGLRIDHVDGLWNPREYLERLQRRYSEICGLEPSAKNLYLLVEKILDLKHEQVPADWPVHGTTGYEFANQMVQVLVEPKSERRFNRIYQRFTGVTEDYADLVYEKKMLTMQISLNSEVLALARMLDELSEMNRHFRDLTRNTLIAVIREVMACFPVYRTYVTEAGEISAEDEKFVLRATVAARRRNRAIEKPVFDFLRNILLMRLPESLSQAQREAHVRFVQKFQQISGPVMAKGVEDTTFYIYNRLMALNEVGGDPGTFGIEVAEFHRLNAERFARSPQCLLATSTHDTKRSEDVRMRLAALSENPVEWDNLLRKWSRANKKHRTRIEGELAPSANEEYLLYQALLGAWPLLPFANDEERTTFTDRINQYALKALKEAKVSSSWTEPNEAWEQAVSQFLERILNPATSASFLESLVETSAKLARAGAMNSMAECVVKCTAPGVPDIYQGTEIWDFSLVDPDNRRPVDYNGRKELLTSLKGADPAALLADWKNGAVKLWILQRLLRFRRDQAEFFQKAAYEAVEVDGSLAHHVIAFQRRLPQAELLVVVPRLTTGLAFPVIADVWQNTRLSAVHGDWRNVLTGADYVSSPSGIVLTEALKDFPFGVLWREIR